MLLTRRAALLGLASAVTLGRASLALGAAATDRRFVVVMLRGALDGLAAVQPYGDRNLAALRPELVRAEPGQAEGLLDLGGFYGLHPSLAGVQGLFRQNEALILHAVAGPTRSRSHFEAQDALELGSEKRLTSGWLNRAAGVLPRSSKVDTALAIGAEVPLLLRGPQGVTNWMPDAIQRPNVDLYARLIALHARDPLTGPALADGLKERGFSDQVLTGASMPPKQEAFSVLCAAAGKLLADPAGPRLAALEIEGWDTHVNQIKRLDTVLKQLDTGLLALKAALGPEWRRTVVLAMTEFGRTARVNGTGGTDHGTGSAAFLLGGAVAGGRVQADWPGLGSNQLFENRDLQPTAELRAVAKGVLAAHLGLDDAQLARVFPDSAAAPSMRGLIRQTA